MSPEIVNKQEYDPKAADIWAVGILAYRMLYGTPPFKAPSEKELYDQIKAGKFTYPATGGDPTRGTGKNLIVISNECKSIINRMLTYDFQARPSASKLL